MKCDSNLSIKLKIKGSSTTRVAPPPKGDLLWGRIITAVLLLIALCAGLVWGIFQLFKQDVEPTLAVTTSEAVSEIRQEPSAPAVVIAKEASTVETQLNLKEGGSIPSKPVEAPVSVSKPTQVTAIDTAVQSEAKQNITEAATAKNNHASKTLVNKSDSAVTPVIADKSTLPNTAAVKKAVEQASVAVVSSVDAAAAVKGLAKVEIFSDHISSAALGQGIKNRKPVADLPHQIALDEETLLAVYFFTNYLNLKGQWIYHDWYRGDKRMARVKSRPRGQAVDVYSSKFIDQYMLGDWTVKAVTQTGEVLASGRFTVVR